MIPVSDINFADPISQSQPNFLTAEETRDSRNGTTEQE